MTTILANKLAALCITLIWITMAIVAAVLGFIYEHIIPLAVIVTGYLIWRGLA